MADRVDPAAHVYAKALHEAAAEAGRVQEVDRDLAALISTLGESPVVLRALVNPALPGEGKRRILVGLLTGSEPLARNAVLVLLEHSRLALLVDLQSAYAELAADDEHILPVEVTTAVALEQKELDALAGAHLGRSRPPRPAHRDRRPGPDRRPRAARAKRARRRLRQAPPRGAAARPDPYTLARWE